MFSRTVAAVAAAASPSVSPPPPGGERLERGEGNLSRRTGRGVAEGADIDLHDRGGGVRDESEEVFVAGDEVRLGVDLDDAGVSAAVGHLDADEPVGGNATSLLAGGGEAALAELGVGRLHVELGRGEGFLDVHQRSAGFLAQLRSKRGRRRTGDDDDDG